MTLVALTHRHVDALREFSNIGVGHAATALSQLIGKPVSMRVPRVNITPFRRVPQIVGGAETLVAGIHFRVMGNVTGDILVVFPEECARMLMELLLGEPVPAGGEWGEKAASALTEIANILTSVRRINLTLGMPIDGSAIELVSYWRRYMKEAPSIAPVTVKSGPLLENVSSGKDVNIQTIPTPRWHEHDGGYYIGTGCMVIMRDPDTGWINYGAYRIQCHDRAVASVMTSKGKHGNLIMRRYHERGEPCPIAVVAGMHPALFMVAGIEIPYGRNEYDAAGGHVAGRPPGPGDHRSFATHPRSVALRESTP